MKPVVNETLNSVLKLKPKEAVKKSKYSRTSSDKERKTTDSLPAEQERDKK
jgi:hypothetical protein